MLTAAELRVLSILEQNISSADEDLSHLSNAELCDTQKQVLGILEAAEEQAQRLKPGQKLAVQLEQPGCVLILRLALAGLDAVALRRLTRKADDGDGGGG